jgi:signal transduction histidine kinase
VRSSGDRAVFSIRDEGIGISAVDQKRIFQIFERAISKDEVSGLGLGLYIARRIVEAHGGTIGVESEVGKGATFTVELPFEPPTASGGRS